MIPSLSKIADNRQRWFDRIGAWKQSGLSQKAFCEQQQLRLGSFQRWRGMLVREEKPEASSAVSFLPVNVTAAPTSNLALVIDDYLRVEIPAGFDPVILKQVVQSLQAASSLSTLLIVSSYISFATCFTRTLRFNSRIPHPGSSEASCENCK